MITTALSGRAVAGFASIVSITVIILAGWGEITRSVTVSGTLVPERGVLRVFSPQQGIVTAKRFTFGDRVEQGQALYILSSDRSNTGGTALAAEVSTAIRDRIATLRTTVETTRKLQIEEQARLARQREDLVAQVTTLADQIRVQADTLALDRRIVERKSGLQAVKIVPIDQLEVSQRQAASDQAQLISLQMGVQRLRQALADAEAQLRELPLKQANQLDDLQRQLAQAKADLADNEMRREIVIAAPETGTVSADLAEVGQTITSGTPMAVIAPHGAALEAHLLVPSTGIGFVRPGAPVALRYQAYPYQKFGTYEGRVRAVSEIALGPAEMEALRVPLTDGSNEPIYRVTVALAKQTVDALGEQQPLRGGMLVDAEVGAETRRVWEWVFEPVYSMRGAAMFGAAR